MDGVVYTTNDFDSYMKYTMVDSEYAAKVYHNGESVLDPPGVDTVIVYSSHIDTEIYGVYSRDPRKDREENVRVMAEKKYDWGDSRVPAYSAIYPGVMWRKAGN